MPFVGDFSSEMAFIFFVKFFEGVETFGILSYESPFLKDGELVGKAIRCTERGNVCEQVIFRNSCQRIADPATS
jgi:hypothetical protein